MTFHIITIFPGLFDSYLSDSIIKKAIDREKLNVHFYNPRDFTTNKHNKVDDTPYGGGPGMVMMVDPIIRTYEHILENIGSDSSVVALLPSPGGKEFTNQEAQHNIEQYTDIIIICGRYEGIDARVSEITDAHEYSIGNYVLTGGELAAMVMIDVISRRIPGVLGNDDSLEERRSASHQMYTRPDVYTHNRKEYPVPEVLRSGNHAEIEQWRRDN